MRERLDRLRSALEREGLEQAVLSHPETVAHLAGYSHPAEDWPVANPFSAGPALLVVTPDAATLVVPDFHAGHAQECPFPVVAYRSYDYEREPDPAGEFERTLRELDLDAGSVGVETLSLPLHVFSALETRSAVPIDELVLEARRRKGPDEIEAIRRASRLADVVQQSIKDEARPGVTEAEVAGLAQAAMFREAGRRLPAILTVTAGEATATGGGEATERVVASGDLVLTDTSPWVGGFWSDSANAVVAGEPGAEQRRVFDAVRRALELAIDLCRPGAVARDVDRQVRESLAEFPQTYPHHTGHGIGAAWSEEPRLTPYDGRILEEEMVLAVEPAVYRPGSGGIRLEHVFVVRASGNEVLTQFEHTL